MKSFYSLLFLTLLSFGVMAQSPEMFNYQGVARDNGGNVLTNQNVGLKFSILDSDGSTVLYSEDQVATTNDFGLFNVQIGNGTVLSGTFAGIGWDSGARFVKVEMDPAGGTAYQNLGTSQLMSVPYALHANSSDDGLPGGSTGNTLRHNGTNWVSASNLHNNGTNIGIGTNSPDQILDIEGNNPRIDITNTVGNTWRIGSDNFNDLSIWEDGFTNHHLIIKQDGQVGIGVSNPSEKLEVNGNIRFPSSGRSILAEGAFNLESTTGVDIIIDNDDNSTNSSFRVKRNSDGSETILEVKENGNIEVEGEYAYASSKTHYQSFSHRSFRSRLPLNYEFGQPGSTSDYGVFVTGGTGLGYANAPINLPDGAVITEVRAWIWDDSNTTPVRVRLHKQVFGTNADLLVATIESSSATAMASVQELATAPAETIDNSTYSYHLDFTGLQNSSDTRLYAVRITYTVSQAD